MSTKKLIDAGTFWKIIAKLGKAGDTQHVRDLRQSEQASAMTRDEDATRKEGAIDDSTPTGSDFGEYPRSTLYHLMPVPIRLTDEEGRQFTFYRGELIPQAEIDA